MKFWISTSDTRLFEMQNALLPIGAVVLAAVVVSVWALKFKKRRRYKYKQRHHRHERHRMNPTLAETGGLPPLREAQNVLEQSES